MSRPNEQEWEALKKFAKRFHFEAVGEYMVMVEYSDWMTEIMDDPEAEMFSDADRVRINEILLLAFEIAHGQNLDCDVKKYYVYD